MIFWVFGEKSMRIFPPMVYFFCKIFLYFLTYKYNNTTFKCVWITYRFKPKKKLDIRRISQIVVFLMKILDFFLVGRSRRSKCNLGNFFIEFRPINNYCSSKLANIFTFLYEDILGNPKRCFPYCLRSLQMD
jgi:hypothetical protein